MYKLDSCSSLPDSINSICKCFSLSRNHTRSNQWLECMTCKVKFLLISTPWTLRWSSFLTFILTFIIIESLIINQPVGLRLNIDSNVIIWSLPQRTHVGSRWNRRNVVALGECCLQVFRGKYFGLFYSSKDFLFNLVKTLYILSHIDLVMILAHLYKCG